MQVSPELRAWLLECPALTAISTLTLDAAALGLVDLTDALPRAVAADVRLRTSYMLHPHRLRRVNLALAQARHLRSCRVEVAGGIAVLQGPIGERAVIAEACGQAMLEIDTVVPHTLATAMARRPLRDLVSSPLLDARPYVVARATAMADRTVARFDVPTVAISRIRQSVGPFNRES